MSMTSTAWPPIQLTVEEDGGLATMLSASAPSQTRDSVVNDPAVRMAAQDALREAFGPQHRRAYLDPFAPAAERNAAVIAALRAAITAQRQRGGPLATVPADDETLIALFAATLGWGPAQRYLDDPRVNEVKIVNGCIRVQEAGKPFVTVAERFASVKEVLDRAQLLAALLGVRLDRETPQETLPVAHGTRMHVTIPPRTTEDGVLVCIRRGRSAIWDLDDVLAHGSLDPALAELLRLFSRARCAMLIAGRTGSGKTGLLEAIANSWPGDPHVISIEDHTAEIGIRKSDTWTREMVDTQRDPGAFGRVAREALRQTPDLLLPGEIRGGEAGAVLALLLSDHPVITTIHARSCAEALERFAACAALPGAYMYEGRRDDALRDACTGFDVVIKMDLWEDLGLRLISEVALVAGSELDGGVARPVVISLAKVDVTYDGAITWRMRARINAGGMLEWSDEQDHTPEPLREKLVRARALTQVRTAATTLDLVQESIGRAEGYLLANDTARALNTLRGAWQQRHDGRLIGAAQRALAQAPARFAAIQAEGEQLRAALDGLLQQRRLSEAQAIYTTLTEDLGRAAAVAPPGGWEPTAQRITAGLALEAQALATCDEATLALSQGHPRAALELLNAFANQELAPLTALKLMRTREQAHTALLARGEGSEEALYSVQAQRQALENALAQEHGAVGSRQ